MPKNKNAFVRVLMMDRLFSSGGYWSKSKLRKNFKEKIGREEEYSDRIIEYDIYDMKSGVYGKNAPISYSVKNKGYYYKHEGYSLFYQTLDEEDNININKAMELIKALGNEELSSKLKMIVNREEIKASSKNIIDFEKNISERGKIHVDDIIMSIKEKAVLEIKYQRFDSDVIETINVHPFFLKQFRQRWYLFGYDENRDQISNFGLERILALERNKYISYKEKHNKDWSEYFKDIVGVSVVNSETIEIIFKVKKPFAKYIEARPIHWTQIIVSSNDDSITFKMNVKANFELEAEFLRMGENVKIISPISFIEKLRTRIDKMHANFNTNTD